MPFDQLSAPTRRAEAKKPATEGLSIIQYKHIYKQEQLKQVEQSALSKDFLNNIYAVEAADFLPLYY